jgi:hypothetical protein
MITDVLATQLTERQAVTINTGAYDVRVSQTGGLSYLRKCQDIVAMSHFGYRFFQAQDSIIIRSVLIQVAAPISVSSQGIPLDLAWYDPILPASYPIATIPIPFENSELVIDTVYSFPIISNRCGITAQILSGAGNQEHQDCRFHMTGLNAAFNAKVIPIVVYARIEHTLPMVID